MRHEFLIYLILRYLISDISPDLNYIMFSVAENDSCICLGLIKAILCFSFTERKEEFSSKDHYSLPQYLNFHHVLNNASFSYLVKYS